MDWTKVVTTPLGLTGFALALVFGVVTTVVARRRKGNAGWIVPAGFTLAALCIIGGLTIAYQRSSSAANFPQNTAAPPPPLQIGTIEQQAAGGAAVAGVQGNVTVNAPGTQNGAKLKQ